MIGHALFEPVVRETDVDQMTELLLQDSLQMMMSGWRAGSSCRIARDNMRHGGETFSRAISNVLMLKYVVGH